jgi:hypothetical protein
MLCSKMSKYVPLCQNTSLKERKKKSFKNASNFYLGPEGDCRLWNDIFVNITVLHETNPGVHLFYGEEANHFYFKKGRY